MSVSYKLSPNASPASPQTTRFPDCAINADIWPTDPFTIISIPFIEIPHLELASPSIINVPP